MISFDRTKNSARSFAFGVLSKIIMIVAPFITRTFIIYKLGAEYLGLTSLFTSVLSILSISELGLSSATVFCLYKPVAEDDKETICALLKFLKKAYLFVGITIIIFGILIMPFLRFFIGGEYPSEINIYILFGIYLLNSALSYLAFAYKRTLFQAYQREDKIHKIEASSEIIKVILQVLVLVIFRNYYIYVAILPLSTLIVTLATEIVSKRQFPDIVPIGSISKDLTKILQKKIVFLSAHKVSSTLINTVDNIVISSFLGLFSVAVYGNYHYISTSIFAFILIAFNSLRPAVANELNVDSREKILKTYESLQFLCVWLLSWCAICMACLYQPFIELWLGKEYLMSIPAMIAVVLFFFTNGIRQFYTSIYIDASGLWNKILFRQIIAAIINLILDLVLVHKFDVFGVVFASFITCLFVSLPLDIYVTNKYVLCIPYRIGLFRALKDFGLLVLLGGGTYYICTFVTCDGILGLIIRGIICCILPNAVIVLLYFRTDKFKNVISHAVGLIKKKM